MKKAFLLSTIIAMSLCSCSLEKRCECLETSNGLTYTEGMCYQASRSNVVESIYLINPPVNPEESPENYKYDITWSEIVVSDNFSFVDGLSGEHVMTILRISDVTIKITFDGVPTDPNATHGYIRILPNAFTGHTDRAIDSVIYAYIAIGDTSGLVAKP